MVEKVWGMDLLVMGNGTNDCQGLRAELRVRMSLRWGRVRRFASIVLDGEREDGGAAMVE
jgi:hypothetical protein